MATSSRKPAPACSSTAATGCSPSYGATATTSTSTPSSISHLHADHFLDLVPYSYALTYAPRQQPVPVDRWPGTDSPAKPTLHAPKGATDVFRRVVGAWGNEDLIENAFDLHEYDPSRDGLGRAAAVRLPRGAALPADLRDRRALVGERERAAGLRRGLAPRTTRSIEFAGGAALLIIEATLPRPERGGVRGHLTPSEAGEHGAKAGVQRLVITHSPTRWTSCGPAARRNGPSEGRSRSLARVPCTSCNARLNTVRPDLTPSG